ncbi:hypothetical protein BDY24DRAFT_434924, partial [Mrakia frigida]|uniref:uncharacterized protein n=1 Tax=Mrakia frigida TaxID=29902 RepID=UPI003FCC115F
MEEVSNLPGHRARAILSDVDAVQSDCFTILRRFGLLLPDEEIGRTDSAEESGRTEEQMQVDSPMRMDDYNFEEEQIRGEQQGAASAASPHLSATASSDDPHLLQSSSSSTGIDWSVWRDRPVRLQDPLKLYITGLHPRTSSSDLEQHFSVFGRVVEAKVRSRTRNDAYGLVTFADPASAQLAVNVKWHRVCSRDLDVRYSKFLPETPEDLRSNPDRLCTLLFASLDPSIRRGDLVQLVLKWGRLIPNSFYLVRSGTQLNSAYVTFEHHKDATRARRELDGELLGSRNVSVSFVPDDYLASSFPISH